MKSQFTTKLRMEDMGGNEFMVIAPLRFYSADRLRLFAVLPGFVTDLASIPRGLWNLFPKSGPYNRAAVLHDAAYNGCVYDHNDHRIRFTRTIADQLFHEAMLADGVRPLRAKLMYLAVRAFGRMC